MTEPRRSDRTKEAILVAAKQRFSQDGYERATIRGIASDAHIDPSMVMRYFGDKERLFAAAADVDLGTLDLSTTSRSALGAAVVRHFLDQWEAGASLQVLVRCSMTNLAAAARVRDLFTSFFVPIVMRLGATADRAPARAGMITGQLLGLATARYILPVEAVAAMSRAEVVAWVGPSVQRYLVGV